MVRRLAFSRRSGGGGGGDFPTLLTSSDFTYIGSAHLSASGWDYGTATYRRSGGTTYLLLSDYVNSQRSDLIEFTVGSLSTNPASFPTWSAGTNYGDIIGGLKIDGLGGDYGDALAGLHYDSANSRLYWIVSPGYTNQNDCPSIGVSSWAGTGSITPRYHLAVPYPYASRGHKAHNIGMTNIPTWFADAYTGGKKIGVGMGGYESLVSSGGVSSGPCISAFDGTFANGDYTQGAHIDIADFQHILYYTGGSGGSCRRNPDYNTPTSGDFISNGLNPSGAGAFDGYWTWCDQANGGAWIDTGTKSGMLFLYSLGHGYCSYGDPEPSAINGESGKNYWIIYDPRDLADCAQSLVNPYQVLPAEEYHVTYNGDSSSFTPWTSSYPKCPSSCVWVPEESRLYVIRPADPPDTKVHVYSVS